MAKVTHTHRGHCQVCLRVHAIDVGTGRLAKHGYTVEGGYFNGECAGSGEPSLHMSRDLANLVIERCDADAARYAKREADLKSGAVVPEQADSGEWVTVEKPKKYGNGTYKSQEMKRVPFAEAPEMYQRREVESCIHSANYMYRCASGHAKMMREWAAKIFDGRVPAYRNEDLESELAVGQTVRIGGKKGFDAVIEAIEDREYTTFGYRRGRQTISIPHARVTRPEKTAKAMNYDTCKMEPKTTPAETFWTALRDIKKPAIPLVEALKKAGLI